MSTTDVSTSGAGPWPDREVRFRTVYEATYPDLLRFVQRRVHPTHAEDIAADVFLVAWRRFDDLPPDAGDARAWLFEIAQRTLLNGQRGDRRRQALTIRIADAIVVAQAGEAWKGSGSELVAHRLDLAAAWSRLTPVHQETLSLAVWDGLDGPQAAMVLGISPVAFRLRLSRARRALRRYCQFTPAQPSSLPAALREGNPS
jgi:RNA polymerase sigma-70 factor (ECF subfamily)